MEKTIHGRWETTPGPQQQMDLGEKRQKQPHDETSNKSQSRTQDDSAPMWKDQLAWGQ